MSNVWLQRCGPWTGAVPGMSRKREAESSTETEKGKFFENSEEYQRLFENAQKNIVNKNDMIYWIPIDRKATCDEIYTLLNRLLNQKRYKYLSDAAYNESKAQIDYDRSITYKEYLEQTQ